MIELTAVRTDGWRRPIEGADPTTIATVAPGTDPALIGEGSEGSALGSGSLASLPKQDPTLPPGYYPLKTLGEPVILTSHVTKNYSIVGRSEPVRALIDIDLSPDSEFYPIRKGEFVMLRGPSGGGKTSLLNVLGTLDRPSSGRVEILGDVITSASPDNFLSALRLRKIGFVFQTFNLLANLSAKENVALPMSLLGKLNAKERDERAKKLLDMVGLRDRVEHLPSELSGGEQQRVAIARALANDPPLLLLDEPTGDLDTRHTIRIMDLLMRLNREHGTTLLMVTHHPDLECYADRVLFVRDGELVMQAVNRHQRCLDEVAYGRYVAERERKAGQPQGRG
ncbi:ABC transporter ATP-binding protein [Fonticula alba]|uniref:ABC transporter ATP-binding protein n=1 Tax=Fonticula alba TaxID=691883 RepID=A0A058Z8E2_FONAL|nr:ABC transporter ATP-binding protein [Fonticula alba]KCV70559.1 ABC transporter ATP-binding protein [Fonticula alba]|eukprot:XP_009495075.1 ABC transporter ATP-binding protein [Fonticula alba]